MPVRPSRLLAAWACLALVAAAPAADVVSLAVHPAEAALSGADDAVQLVVTATLADGRLLDVTGDAQYAAGDAKVARVTPAGRVLPGSADGTTTLAVRHAGKSAAATVRAAGMGTTRPINFPNRVVPVFTKLGCNSGGCHGKSGGQNGFRLSLLGFEPDLDYTTLVKEGRGRRLFPSAPDASLLLTKATGTVAHGGGRKLEPDSDEYKLVRRWVASGAPYGSPDDPVVTRISVWPDHRVLSRQSKQQVAAYAHYSDGTVEDITRRAQYESNDQEIAVVDAGGVVRTLSMSGEAAIMTRYQGHVAAFRATVPLGEKTPAWDFPERSFVDRFTARKWRDLGLVPSAVCGDETFARRVSLDLTGTLPTPAAGGRLRRRRRPGEARQARRPAARDAGVQRTFSPTSGPTSCASSGARRTPPAGPPARSRSTPGFARRWPPTSRTTSSPATSSRPPATRRKNPPVVWCKDLKDPENFVDDTAQVFLGLRIACANCHHHPYEKWARTTIGAWPRSSAGSAASRSR